MVSSLVLLVHSFPHEKLPRSPIPFKLQFDVDMANFEINVTIDDVLFNDIDIEIKIYIPMEFLGMAQERRVTFSYLF
jgi:hypothetical protein